LQQRQHQEDDPGILPKVGLDDVPPEVPIPTGERRTLRGHPLTFYPQGTNGLVYQQIIAELPALEDRLLDQLSYYAHALPEVGCGGRDYLKTQTWQDRVSGGINAYTSMRGRIDDVQDLRAHFVLSGKALATEHAEFARLMEQTLTTVRFDEPTRLREIVSQERARMEQSVTGHGHVLAMTAAASGMSPAAAIGHRLRGLMGIRTLKAFDDGLKDPARLAAFTEGLREIHERILAAPRQFLLVAEDKRRDQLLAEFERAWSDGGAGTDGHLPFAHPAIRAQVRQLWVTSTQVNFCAKVYPTVPVEHPDAPALDVLGVFLRNGFLHRAIREKGGAYGGGAGHDADNAGFRFYSYRDPRLEETLADFDAAIDWLLDRRHEARQLEEAILGIIGGIDKPGSPAGEAKSAFHHDLYGRTPDQRRRHRLRILEVTLDDLKRVGERYLKPEQASIAVITNPERLQQRGDLGLDVFRL
jgi:presequence protease